ncbi:hypothetical protein HYY73_06270 [Candidatus Woesearchaeota archaeon]|nr:hypothetical protein [Candidatus Woesearchaeota archaeon]
MTSHAAKGNRPIPANNEKNTFSSASRPVFFSRSKTGRAKSTVIPTIARKPGIPKRAKATAAITTMATSHAA